MAYSRAEEDNVYRSDFTLPMNAHHTETDNTVLDAVTYIILANAGSFYKEYNLRKY